MYYLKILHERPDHPFVLFNLGMTHAELGQHETAVAHLRRCLAVSDPGESHVRKAHALLVASLQRQGHLEEAWDACRVGREQFPADPELLFRLGMLAHALGRLEEAEQAYRDALANRDRRHFSSVDPAIIGYKTRHNLALVYQSLGREDLAELQWRHVIAEVPGFRSGHSGLVDTLLRQRKYHAAEIEIETMLAEPGLQGDGRAFQARLLTLAAPMER